MMEIELAIAIALGAAALWWAFSLQIDKREMDGNIRRLRDTLDSFERSHVTLMGRLREDIAQNRTAISSMKSTLLYKVDEADLHATLAGIESGLKELGLTKLPANGVRWSKVAE